MFKIISILCFTFLVSNNNNVAQINNNSVLLYSQTDLITGYPVQSNDFGAGHENLNCQVADDFAVDDDWAIDQIVVSGLHENDFTFETGFNIYIYSDTNMMPGELVYFNSNQPFTQNVGTDSPIIFTITLQTPAMLTSGNYWISIQAQMNWTNNAWEFWYWNQVNGSFDNIAQYQNPGGSWSQGCTSWNSIPDCFQGFTTQTDMYFELWGNTTLPVELSSFTASASSGVVELNWITSTETNNQGFEIERSKMPEVNAQMEWEKIGFVEGHGTTTESQAYSFTNKNVATGKYNYRLKQKDYNGTFEYSNVVEVEVTSPLNFSLEQNYPNPFNPSTMISYQLPVNSNVTLKIFNTLGQEVATLVNEEKPAGNYDIDFNAASLPSGVYLYRIQTGNYIETKKMILLK